jgi:hypothetical protein
MDDDKDQTPPPRRMMKCSYSRGRDDKTHEPVPSDPKAAFFEARPDEPMDKFYCGCWGWE